MKTQFALTVFSTLALSLTACQKFQSSPLSPGNVLAKHGASANRLNTPWTLATMTCTKSGKDLAGNFELQGSTASLTLSETLVFTPTTVLKTDTFTGSPDGSTSISASEITNMNYSLKPAAKNQFTMSTTVTSVNSADLESKLGLQDGTKVGDKLESSYIATGTSLTLIRPSYSGECEDSTDTVTSTYK